MKTEEKNLDRYLGDELSDVLYALQDSSKPIRLVLPINRKNATDKYIRVTKIVDKDDSIEIFAAGFRELDG